MMSANPYNLGKPTERDLIASLEKVMGPQKAELIMKEAREFCGTNNSGDPLLPLTKISVWLSKQKGIASVVGRSMKIRITFYISANRTYEYAQN